MKKTLPLLLLLMYITSFAQKKVLFIGNSYTGVNDLPGLVYNVALANGDTIIYDSYSPGGYTFELHSTDINAINKINSNSWDFVVLQEQSQRPSFPPSQVQTEVYPFAITLDSMIHANNVCTQTVFYMTWGRKYGDQSNCGFYPPLCTYAGMQERLRESYLEMGDLTHARVSPVGVSFQNSIAADSTLELYQSDFSHPSVAGSYLAACTFYSTLFKKSTVGTSYTAGLAPAVATYLQNIATHTVLDSLETWKIGVYEPNAAFTYVPNGLSAQFTADSVYSNSHQWSFGGSTPSPSFTFATGGDFSVTHIACDACRCDTSTQLVHISSIGIDEAQFVGVSIFPNPTKDEIVITDKQNEIVQIELYDAQGKLIQKITPSSKERYVIAAPHEAGVYILKLLNAEGVKSVKRIVVE